MEKTFRSKAIAAIVKICSIIIVWLGDTERSEYICQILRSFTIHGFRGFIRQRVFKDINSAFLIVYLFKELFGIDIKTSHKPHPYFSLCRTHTDNLFIIRPRYGKFIIIPTIGIILGLLKNVIHGTTIDPGLSKILEETYPVELKKRYRSTQNKNNYKRQKRRALKNASYEHLPLTNFIYNIIYEYLVTPPSKPIHMYLQNKTMI
jgi:hypothetical protein